MNSGFLITDAGLAAASIATPTGPYIFITGFKVGSGVGYVPDRAMTDLQGTLLYTGVASGYSIVDENTVEVLLVMAADVGPFNFGEIGLYLDTGELFALLVFDNLQEKIRAVGTQAGATWRIRARILLAQAPVLITVQLINSQGILEVPNWQSLQKPVDQLMNANIAIVHANNSSDDPVLVIRDNDDEWGLVDYTRVLDGLTTDTDAVLTTSTFTHPEIAGLYFEDMPRSDSKYLIKFPDGSIRQITSYPGATQVGFSPNVAVSVGQIQIWEEGGGTPRVAWADTYEYNDFVTDFNPYWANPVGPYRIAGPDNVPFPESNKGKGQTPIPLLSRRTNTLDWLTLMTAVRANCEIHGISTNILENIVDFVYRPVPPYFFGMESLRQQWLDLQSKIGIFETRRNDFDILVQDQALIVSSTDNVFWDGIKTFRHEIYYESAYWQQAMLNSGHEIRFSGEVTDVINGDWFGAQALINAIGTIRIIDNTVVASVGVVYGIGLQELTNSFQNLWTYTLGGWTITLRAREIVGSPTIVMDILLNNTGSSPYSYTPDPPGLITFDVYSRRPASAVLNTPVLDHPTASFTIISP